MRGVEVPEATLSGVIVYPLKSAGGIALDRARVGARGIDDDRRWMVVDEAGEFVSQRSHPRMALVRVRFAGGGLVVTAPGLPELVLPRPAEDAPRRTVTVWRDAVAAPSAGRDAAAWMTEHLGCRCDVVYLPDDAERTVEPGFGPQRQVSFADAFPFLLVSEGSLAGLNARLAQPVPMDRFRPNLVVSGCPPHAEDGWTRIAVGEVRFAVVKACSRCTTTVVDQDTGKRGSEPLATLSRYRRVGNSVVFGQNLVHVGEGELAVGDPVTVLAARPA